MSHGNGPESMPEQGPGTPYEPLTEEDRARYQSVLRDKNAMPEAQELAALLLELDERFAPEDRRVSPLDAQMQRLDKALADEALPRAMLRFRARINDILED